MLFVYGEQYTAVLISKHYDISLLKITHRFGLLFFLPDRTYSAIYYIEDNILTISSKSKVI